MDLKNLLVTQSEGIAEITINRPDKLNALNKATIQELSDALDMVYRDSAVRVIILTGAGDKSFVAGADISEFAHFSTREGEELSAHGHELLFSKLEQLTKPVIAAINGFALGGGLELALSAHIRLAADSARLGLPEVTLGVIPGYGGTQRLTRLTGPGKAMEMITTGGMIDAGEALQWGIVNHVFPAAELMGAARKMADKIARNSRSAVASAIRAVNAHYDCHAPGLEAEIREFGKCFGTPDFKEGTSAFLEKRKPKFQ